MRVAVLGASDNPERYSYKAVTLLKKEGHAVLPVNPKLESIEGVPVFASLDKVPGPIDTVSVYLSPEHSSKLEKEILSARPKRLIFNPGAENPELAAKASAKGIHTLEACTLVLLTTGQFESA